MEHTSIVLLASNNYFQWKSHMEDLLRSKGLYKITLGTKTAPDDDEADLCRGVKWCKECGKRVVVKENA